MSANDLMKIYKAVIRAGVEYCSVVYHSLIPEYMAAKLERVQIQAMKIIHGRNLDYKQLLDSGQLEVLEERRENAVRKFAIKA